MIGQKKIGVLILAAGASSRLGRPKQLVDFQGKPLLQHVIDATEPLGFDTRVLVLGAGAEVIMAKIDHKNFDLVINEHWEEGMAASIRQGVSASLDLDPELEHLVILLSDQPLVSREKIGELINLQLENQVPATFSGYGGEVGVPAIFSRKVFPHLKKLKGDQGAKKLIGNRIITYQCLKIEEGTIDVDQEKDVELLKLMEQK